MKLIDSRMDYNWDEFADKMRSKVELEALTSQKLKLIITEQENELSLVDNGKLWGSYM